MNNNQDIDDLENFDRDKINYIILYYKTYAEIKFKDLTNIEKSYLYTNFNHIYSYIYSIYQKRMRKKKFYEKCYNYDKMTDQEKKIFVYNYYKDHFKKFVRRRKNKNINFKEPEKNLKFISL